jgi:effector-binding domain-containing protein
MQAYEIQTQSMTEQPTAVAATTLAATEIGPWLTKTYGIIAKYLAAKGVQPVGPAFGRYHMLDGGRFSVEAGFPVDRAIAGDGDVMPSSLPGGTVAKTIHVGPYDQMRPAYAALSSWVKARGGELTADAWEVYVSDPSEQPDPAAWCTEVVQPYREA